MQNLKNRMLLKTLKIIILQAIKQVQKLLKLKLNKKIRQKQKSHKPKVLLLKQQVAINKLNNNPKNKNNSKPMLYFEEK